MEGVLRRLQAARRLMLHPCRLSRRLARREHADALLPWHLLPGARASSLEQSSSKKQPRIGTARWLCSGHRPERSAWLDGYARDLLARSADMAPSARGAGQHWSRRGAAKRFSRAPVAGSDDAEARCAARRRCGGFAQSCGRRRFLDRGRSDLCARHQHGSCDRSFVLSSAIRLFQ